jgi:HPt (histidine-containing phosphotransfer) domain-containing protein
VRLQQLAARIEAQCKAGHLPTAAEVARLDETLADTCRAAHAHLAGAGQPASASSPP